MKGYFGYIRVSTARQGEEGASLPEQRAQIDSYAKRQGLVITHWFEERETAAKSGRKIFAEMLHAVRRGRAQGIMFHKIDRSARNYDDWAAIQRLLEDGIDVHIAGDSIDLKSRSGRLTANILAAIAVDYIANLKEEVRKGQVGRLKQGLYPWGAPVGYQNNGGTQVKTIDAITGPLVRRAFEEYGSGRHTLRTLQGAMAAWGLTGERGKPLSINSVNLLLRRTFYIGLITVRGETYVGRHERLIPKPLFDRVQEVLDGRSGPRIYRTERPYLFQRMLVCRSCQRHLYAETQKGHVYYRCHSEGCEGTSLREQAVLIRFFDDIHAMGLSDTKRETAQLAIAQRRRDAANQSGDAKRSLQLRLDQLKERLVHVEDAYFDGVLDKERMRARQTHLHKEQLNLEEQLATFDDLEENFSRRATHYLELLESLQHLTESANPEEMRTVLQRAISNCDVQRKYVDVHWRKPVQALFVAEPVLVCAHTRDDSRTVPAGHDCASLTSSTHQAMNGATAETVFTQVAELLYQEQDQGEGVGA